MFRTLPVAVVLTVIGGLVAGCGDSGMKVSLASPPAQQVELARASNSLFSIFPAQPGTKKCLIPNSAHTTTPVHGTCQTSIDGANTHEPALIVTFTETWNIPPCAPSACTGVEARQHTWRVVEAKPFLKTGARLSVAATHSSGVTAPQGHN